MLAAVRRKAGIYSAFAAIVPKTFLAYTIWVWMELVVQIIWLTVMVYFWRAVYAEQVTLGGLSLAQTLNYILLVQTLGPLLQADALFHFGSLVRDGSIAIELLRPIDFQSRRYVENLAAAATTFVLKIPVLIVAVLAFGLSLPTDPLVWGAFVVSILLGQSVLFYFDWIFGCLAFYSTETWGLAVLREGIATFFSGALLPLSIMPLWLQNMAYAMPFAQTLYVPMAILSGIIPLAEVGRAWLIQIAWLVGLILLSRLAFGFAIRKVTVQGG